MLAGEASGDLHGAQVAQALKNKWPGVSLLGLGGPRMEKAGVRLLAGLEDLAVMGFVEVLRHLPFFWGLERRLKSVLDQGDVDLLLPIDYPGFNLRMAREAHQRGIPVLYYIAPQVWAWKPRRAHRLAGEADRIAVILPFEERIFEEVGGTVRFVGHPLLDGDEEPPDRTEFFHQHGLDPDRPLLALFPGSRPQEIRRHGQLFLETGRRVRRARPSVQLAVARAKSMDLSKIGLSRTPVVDDSRALLHHAAAALVKSGTTTLEAALAGVPFVTVYKTHPITYLLAKRLVRVPHVALANLVAGERVVPEILQGEATPETLCEHLLPILDEGTPERGRMVAGLERVRDALGSPGAAARVADMAADLLAGARWPDGGSDPGGFSGQVPGPDRAGD